jgi:hypothetical protein
VSSIKNVHNLPTTEDYDGAILGIHRLEDTYQLDPMNLSSSNISMKHPSRPLTGKIKSI